MSYYEEKARAIRTSDFIINEVLYIQDKQISIVELEIKEVPRFKCSFMKVFKERLGLFMDRDKGIVYDKELKIVRLEK